MSQTLDELVEVLGVLAEMANQGRQAFDADRRQRWSIECLWIFAGNLAERHCRVLGINEGTDPWSELIARSPPCKLTRLPNPRRPTPEGRARRRRPHR